ncbi:hypothetical protein F5Y18DRAFT_389903 [Xylariaceae sp. FL1019]|nr:hypothetical protein F5Y18DRAFT_389903 [Xylariaceae sp. FL1019]
MALLAKASPIANDDEVFIKIDPDGDLELLVGHEAGWPMHHFIVCSKALARSSPVFKAMLYGGFSEAKNNQNPANAWVVELAEDDPYAMEMLLSTIHGNFDTAPVLTALGENGDIDCLYELTALVDKYDLMNQLRPWTHEFIQPHLNAYAKTKQRFQTSDEALKYLWVAYVIGDQDLFRGMSGAYIETCDVHLSDLKQGSHEHMILSPPDFIDKVKAFRYETVQKYLEALQTLVSETEARNPKKRPLGGDSMPDLLKEALRSQSIWPLPSVDEFAGSVWALNSKTNEVFDRLGRFIKSPHVSAAQLTLADIQEEIDNALDEFADGYFKKKQAMKTGFKGRDVVTDWRKLFNLDY